MQPKKVKKLKKKDKMCAKRRVYIDKAIMKEQAKNRGTKPRFSGNGLSGCSAHYG